MAKKELPKCLSVRGSESKNPSDDQTGRSNFLWGQRSNSCSSSHQPSGSKTRLVSADMVTHLCCRRPLISPSIGFKRSDHDASDLTAHALLSASPRETQVLLETKKNTMICCVHGPTRSSEIRCTFQRRNTFTSVNLTNCHLPVFKYQFNILYWIKGGKNPY